MRVALLNTTIATAEGNYRLSKITDRAARRAFPTTIGTMDEDKAGMHFTSAIGHQSTADAMSALLGFRVPVCRAHFKQAEGQEALCLRVRGRIEEGRVLDREALEEIGYDLYLLYRLPQIQVTEPLELMNLAGPYDILATFSHDYDGMEAALRYAQDKATGERKCVLVGTKDGLPGIGFDGHFDGTGRMSFAGFGPTITLPSAEKKEEAAS